MGSKQLDIPKRNLCCGMKPKYTIYSLSYGSSNDAHLLKCRVCGLFDRDFKTCETQLEAVVRWNKLVENKESGHE